MKEKEKGEKASDKRRNGVRVGKLGGCEGGELGGCGIRTSIGREGGEGGILYEGGEGAQC